MILQHDLSDIIKVLFKKLCRFLFYHTRVYKSIIYPLLLQRVHLLKQSQQPQGTTATIWYCNTELPKSAVALSRQGRRRKRKPW